MSWRTSLAAVVVAAIVAAGCGDDGATERLADIEVFDFDGQPQTITLTERPLVINFFAESCAPCVAEMPAFEAVFQRVEDRVDFVGISEDATAAAAQRIIEATGITYRVAWDANGTAFGQFEALGMPTTVLIDASGEVLDVHTGALSQDALMAMVTDLLAAT